MGKIGFDLPGPRVKNEFIKQEPPHSLADFVVTVQILRSSVPS